MISTGPEPSEPVDLRNVIETIPALVVCALPDSSVAFVNRAWREYTGFTPQQPTESHWQSAIHPDDRARFLAEWSLALSAGKSFETEARLRSADGRHRWFLVKKTMAVLRTGKDKPSLVTLIAFEDIEERKQAEQAREETQEQWRTAFENSPIMYFIVDAAGALISVNNFGAEQMGYTVDELLGKPLLNSFFEPDRQAVADHFRECFDHPGQTLKWEARKIRKDGTVVWVREKGNAVCFRKRRVLLIACEDITEQRRAEEAAQRSESELRDVIKLVPAYVWTATPDGAVDFVNERWRDYSGLMMDRILGWSWVSVLHPDDLSKVAAAWNAAVESGQSMEAETRVRRADGEYRWWFCRNVPLRDDLGSLVKWYGTGIDIDDRKRAESLLAGEKRILEMVARGESLAEILDGLCRLVEEQAAGVLASILLVDGGSLRHGAAPSLPRPYTEAIDGAPIGPAAGSCGTAAYRGQQVIVEDIAADPLWADYRALALSHSLRACWSTPVFSSQGKVIATFAMYYRERRSPSARDQEVIEQITHLAGVAIERKLTQEVLRRSETHLAEAQKLAHMGSWVWEARTRNALYVSGEWYRVSGFDPGAGTPTWAQRLARVHPDDCAAFQAKIERAIAEKSDYDVEFRIVPPGGPVRFIRSVGHPVLDPSGELLQFLAVEIDVTDSRQAEEERERLRQQLAHLAHLDRVSTIGELTASLAHEIKQPIGAAVTNAAACLRLLNRDQPDVAEARDAALEMARDARRAADIVDRVRSLYQKGTPRQEAVDVNQVIEEMVGMLAGEASKFSVAMRTNLAHGIPKVLADRVQLQQALMNLMLNGIEAMHDSPGELSIESGLAEDGQVLVSVTDAGIGLPAGDAVRIFNAFVTTKPHGTGLGLAITRSIIESHGGSIRAFANPGPGATFQFALPAAEPLSA